MNLRLARSCIVPLLLAAALPACVVTTDAPEVAGRNAAEVGDDVGRADRIAAAGDLEEAARLYERALETNPASPVLREKLENTRRRAAQRRATAALDAAARGDSAAARGHIEVAERFGADVPAVRRARSELEGTLRDAGRAAAAKVAARELLRTNPGEARAILEAARRHDPHDVEIVRLLREATLRAEADRAAARANAAWDTGDRERAVRDLLAATYAGSPVAAAEILRVRMEDDLLRESTSGASPAGLRASRATSLEAGLSASTTRALGDRLVAALVRDSRALLGTGRPAVAALLETEALRLGADIDTPALDAIATRARVMVAVRPFEDATGGDVDGLRLAAALAARIEADARRGGANFGVIPPGDDQDQRIQAEPRALVLTGVVRSQRIGEGPRTAVARRVPFVAGTEQHDNPAFERLQRDADAIGTEIERAQRDIRAAEDEVRRLEAIPFLRGTSGRSRGDGKARYEMEIARAESRAAILREDAARLAARQQAIRVQMRTTPAELTVERRAETTRNVIEFRKAAEVTAALRLVSGGDTLLDASVTGSAAHDETIAAALPSAGLAADPDDTPDDAQMARLAIAHFAAVAAGRIRSAAESAARAFLVDARAAERAGRRDDAAEAYALYLLATAEVATPHRADAARALEELAGVHVPLRTGAEDPQR